MNKHWRELDVFIYFINEKRFVHRLCKELHFFVIRLKWLTHLYLTT